MSIGAINVRCFWPFWPSASVKYFWLRYFAISCSVLCRTPIYRTCLKNTTRKPCLRIQFSAIFTENPVLISKKTLRKRFKYDYIINNMWFWVTCNILHNLQNRNLQTSFVNSMLCNFWIKQCLNQPNKSRKLI